MENASKALLMAGGILIAIIIISVLVKTYGKISVFQKQQLTAEEAEQIEEYNKEYTKYLNQYVYGTEVITVINKAENYGSTTVYVNGNVVDASYKETEGLKTMYFKCTKIEYNSAGRVNSIYFIEKQIQ